MELIYFIQAIWGFALSAILLAVWFAKHKRGALPDDQVNIMPAVAELFSLIAIAQTLYGAKLIGRPGAVTIMGLALLAFIGFSVWQLKNPRRPTRERACSWQGR